MNKRPTYLNLVQIRLPVTGFVSILHRISGLILFLLIPFLLYIFQQSLLSEAAFHQLGEHLSHPLVKILVWSTLTGLLYHLIAGCRHLMMDMHIGDSKPAARRSAYLVLTGSAVIAAWFAWSIWGSM